MEPFTAAMTFATTVSLLSDFVASRKRGQAPTVEDFQQWLREANRTDVLDSIARSHASTVSLKAVFNERADEILSRLHGLDTQLARIAASFGPLGLLAIDLRPDARISEGSVEILLAMERAGASIAIEVQDFRGMTLVFDAQSINFTPSDPRFYEDDVAVLVETGMVRESLNRSGRRVLQITRQGAQLARAKLHASGSPQTPREDGQ
jgi:hypothetical protein